MKRKRNHPRGLRPPAAGHPVRPSATPAAPVSRGRKWLVRFLAICLPLLVVFGGTELLLRLFGYGYDPHFFKREMVAGRECYVANQDFGLRFFPRSMVRFSPEVVMPVQKAPNTFRIFIFGESAALGDPRPNYGAGCFLEALLAERFPQAKFEIVNTGITAIDSHVILPIARECARHEGDLWLIYMGNNEMVGPFGAVTVFGVKAPPLWLARAQLELRRLRFCQLLLDVSQKFRKAGAIGGGWHGMEMFVQNQVAPDDPSRQRVYRNFDQNLNDILEAGLDSGAKVVLSTVSVNLKDCPPFASVPGPNLASADRAEYEKCCQAGTVAQSNRSYAQGQSDFQRAAQLFPRSAEAQFQLATCWLPLTNASVAWPHFQQAVDDDTLPFRADSRINESIRSAARRLAGDSLRLCDAVESLRAASPDGVPGEDLFYEHVHLNPDGNYALARAWADQVEILLPAALKRGEGPSWASQAECERRLGLTDWNRVSILEEILQRMQRPPFSGQSGNLQRLSRMGGEIARVRQRLTDDAAVQAREIYLSTLRREPNNVRLHENYAEFLEARHELEAAVVEREKVCELAPLYYFPYYALGLDLKDAGDLPKALEALRQANALKPGEGDILLELGTVYARQGNWEQARQELEAARRLRPEEPRAALFLGEVLWKLNRRSEALASLRDAIRLDPSNWQPHYRLADDLAKGGDFAGAAAEYQEVLRLGPDNVKAKLALAVVLLNLGRESQALQQLDEAAKLEPDNQAVDALRRKIRGL